jgi:hypothetical protein
MSGNVRLIGRIQFDRNTLPDPPRSLVAFVSKLAAAEEEYKGPQRRKSPRYRAVVPVVAMPLDCDFRPQGTPFAAITRDLSMAGLRLFSTRAANSELLAVELTFPSGQSKQVVLEVFRCKTIGHFYEIAGQIVARADSPPA